MIHGVNTFLPLVKKASSTTPTAFVITGSKQGITNPPGNPAYNASKAAVKSLAEQLSYDLKDTNTSVHLLVPGWTFTGLVSIPPMIPSQLSDIIEDGGRFCGPEARWRLGPRAGSLVHVRQDDEG